MTAMPVVEVAIYTVKPESVDFVQVQQAAHEWVATLPGFTHSLRLRGLGEQAGIYADCVLWASLEEGQAASDQMQSSPAGQAMGGALADLLVFDHGALLPELAIGDLAAPAAAVELAVLQSRGERAAILADFPAMLAEAQTQPDLIAFHSLEMHTLAGAWANLVLWGSAAAAERARPALSQGSGYQRAAAHIESAVFSGLFEVLGRH